MAAKSYKYEHNGKTYEFPSFKEIPMGPLRKSRKATDDGDKAFIIIEELFGEGSEELNLLDSLTSSEFAAFLKGWTQGAPSGESSSSES